VKWLAAIAAVILSVAVLSGVAGPREGRADALVTSPAGSPLAADDPSGSAAVVHDGYTSVFTVNQIDRTLQENFLAQNGQPWQSQNLSSEWNTPPVAAGTSPVAVFHDGYTSVFTISAYDNTLQETFLPALGHGWVNQNMLTSFGTPPVAAGTSPAVVFHDGYTSVYTINAFDDTLEETFLPAIGQRWQTQNMFISFGTPRVAAGTSPAALFHTGYTSVFTANANHNSLQETYLPAIGQRWQTQSLTANSGTPNMAAGTSPAPVLHTSASGVLNFTSVFTVNAADNTLQETYLSAVGKPWVTQNLSANSGTPPIANGTIPVALYHTGYTSVYTVNAADNTLQETYLAQNGQPWNTQNLSASFGTSRTMADTSPVAVVHPDSSGVVDFTSVFTLNAYGDVQETYLSAIGRPWHFQIIPTPLANVP
jgi:hypothetical protein